MEYVYMDRTEPASTHPKVREHLKNTGAYVQYVHLALVELMALLVPLHRVGMLCSRAQDAYMLTIRSRELGSRLVLSFDRYSTQSACGN